MADEGVIHFQTRLPAKMHRELQALANRERSSMNREVIIAVRTHLDAATRARAVR